ncbi:MAG TPA: precorrin-6A reductase [Ruminiclostridium sp.]
MRVLVFAGTTEGKEISSYLAENGILITACVATQYGEMVMPHNDRIEVRIGRLEAEQMADIMQNCEFVIDATHPYACFVTNNIKAACAKMNKEYIRLLRPSTKAENVVVVKDVNEAASYLNTVVGNALLTTGSKELEAFTAVKDFETRLYVRVLPTPSVVEKCNNLGFKGRNLICMQGPFSHELNAAMLKQVSAKYIVTKDTGDEGGFKQKISAANENGVAVVLIARPSEDEGLTLLQLKADLARRLCFNIKNENSHFPLFVDIKGKRILVVGGGTIATRRVNTLLKFGVDICVVSHSFTPELQELCDKKAISIRTGSYEPGDMENAFLVIAATNDREVNHAIFLEAQKRNIPVNVIDSKEECNFYFPAIFEMEGVIGGLISRNGSDHKLVKAMADKIRQLEAK